MIKAVIADDIQILRQGLRAILEQDKDIRVVGLAADGREAWQLCRKHRPDVVLMDMRMPEYDGSYGITRIKEDYPDIKVLVLTTFDDRETVDAAVGSGADGYILKEMEDDKVIQGTGYHAAGCPGNGQQGECGGAIPGRGDGAQQHLPSAGKA